MTEQFPPGRVLRFGLYEVDIPAAELRKNGLRVKLQDRPFEILKILLERPGEVITREELQQRLFPADTFVDFDHSLNASINKLRRALGDDADNPRFVATSGRRGYRFISPVSALDPVVGVKNNGSSPAQTSDAANAQVEGNAVGATQPAATVEELSTNRPPDHLLDQSKPGSRISWTSLGLLVALILVATFASLFYLRHHSALSSGRVMLAVLPFENLTGDPEQEYFADGLTEELITQLSRLHPEQLGVIARTSVMGYKHGDKHLDQIGRELSVQYVLEGSVRKTADRLRITAQLISVKDQSHVWAQAYDRKPQEILSVQDEVAIAVANEIQVKLGPNVQSELTREQMVNPEAHEDYLKGRYFWNQRTPEGLKKSAEYFESAISKDPNYARAYAGLADAYVLLGGYGVVHQKDAMPKAKAAAQKALAIDDHLAEAYISLGLIAEESEWNWREAEKNYKRAIELNPNYSVAHHFYGDGYLGALGKTDEAIAELRKAHELDPLSLVIASDLGKYLGIAHRYDEAIAQFRKILEIDPDFELAHIYLSQVYEQEGLFPEALAEIQKIKSIDNSPLALAHLGHIYAQTGRKQEALRIVEELQQTSRRTYVDSWQIAYVYVALGERDQAFKWLDKAYEESSPGLTVLKIAPFYDPLRPDPRFQNLMRRVGLSGG